MPGMKAVGMKTAARMIAMAMTGDVTCSIALKAASFGDSPSSMCCSTASTTTMASSTTRPMASTRPKSESVLIEKPSSEHGEGADERHGHREQGDQRGAPALQEDEDDDDDEGEGLEERLHDLPDALAHCQRGVERGDVVD